MMNLKKQYQFSLNLSIMLLISSVAFIITGIILCTQYNQIYWVGMILIILGLLLFVEFFIIRAYVKKKITKIDNQEQTE